MDIQGMLAIFKLAWSYAPFPFLLVVLILLAFAWLWVEYQVTRAGRAIPGWHRPVPILPGISRVSAWIIRLSWTLMWVWLILFMVLSASVWAERNVLDYSVSPHQGVLTAGRIWHQGYDFAAGKLLAPAPDWLKPSTTEPADLSS